MLPRSSIIFVACLPLVAQVLNAAQAYHATVNSTAYTSTAVASGDAVTAVLDTSVQARSMLSSSADTAAVVSDTTATVTTTNPTQTTMQSAQEGSRQNPAAASTEQLAVPAHRSSTGTVIGGVLGGACGAVALAAGWIWFQSRKHSKPLKAAVAAGMLSMPAQPQAGKKAQVYGSFEWKQGAATAAAAKAAAAANASKPPVYTPPTGYTPSSSTAMNSAPAKPHKTTVWGTPGRPHAVQVSHMQAGVPATPHPSPAGNRYTGYTSGYASAQGQQLPVSYSSQAAHMQMQGAHPVPQAASLGRQQRVSAGGLQQPIAAKTFDEVWASLNKLSPIREHF